MIRWRLNSDARLRELERRWRESGSAQDHAAYLRQLIRTGQVDPARLWILARMNAPERAAIQLALEEPIPIATQWVGPYPILGKTATSFTRRLWYSLLTHDIDVEVGQRRHVPIERVRTRYQAWIVLMQQAHSLRVAQGVGLPDWFDNTYPGVIDAASLQRTVRMTEHHVASGLWSEFEFAEQYAESTSGAAFALMAVADLLFEAGALARAVEVPERWVDEALEVGENWGAQLGELDPAAARDFLEVLVAQRLPETDAIPWSAVPHPELPGDMAAIDQVDVDLDRGALRGGGMIVLAYPNQVMTEIEFNLFLRDSLLAWLRDDPLPAPPPRATFPAGGGF